ncbi:helix-turn-helix domain-containing protein [Saliphagus sp. GCM10025308]
MREFVFALEYDPGTNPVADVLADHPDARIRSLSCHVTPDSLWRVDHATGPTEALEALEAAYQDAAYFADCLVRDDCGASCETQILDRSSDTRIVYTFWERTEECTSVPHLALEHFGPGLLFETDREGRRHRWRIVLGDEAPIHDFFDALDAEVGECTGIEMLRLTDVDPDRSLDASPDDGLGLSTDQLEALRAAVEAGYYETPRAVELSELAEDLEIPRSTLSYRLRRAEAALAQSVVSSDDSLEAVLPAR